MKCIASPSNPLFKAVLKLADSSRQRRKAGRTLLDGVHLIQAYLDAGLEPQQVLVTPGAMLAKETAELLRRLEGIPLAQLDEALFAELTELKTPSGIIALIELPRSSRTSAPSRFCLLLEDIQDPGNLGSMIRSAAAAGCDALFLSKGCADAWSPKVLRAGMGGHFVLDIHESADLPAVAADFPGKVLAAELRASDSLYTCDLRGHVAFAIGNEGSGLSESLLAASARRIFIPMPGKTESLNAAAAAAVCLFEAVRQRG